MRRVHTLRTTVEFMPPRLPVPSRSFPFNFIRNTPAIARAIASMQIGWNGLASFLNFNPTCILYVEEQTRKMLYLIWCLNWRVASVATTKPWDNWKFFGIAILDEGIIFNDTRFWIEERVKSATRFDNWLILHREQWFSMISCKLILMKRKLYNFNIIELCILFFFFFWFWNVLTKYCLLTILSHFLILY